MTSDDNLRIARDFFDAMGDRARLRLLMTDDVEWIIPGRGWPLAGTHRGHDGIGDLLQTASEQVETEFPEPLRFVAQGDRVMAEGFATGLIKATNKRFEDHFVFAFTISGGKVSLIREYVDTQALADASTPEASA
jgi:uncharacterized protein